jgi:hypothetical protein
MINKINNEIKIEKSDSGQEEYVVTVRSKKTGDILYEQEGMAGLLTTLETGKIDNLEIVGQHQVIGWGNLLYQAHLHKMAQEYFFSQAGNLAKALQDAGAIANGTEEDVKRFFENLSNN